MSGEADYLRLQADLIENITTKNRAAKRSYYFWFFVSLAVVLGFLYLLLDSWLVFITTSLIVGFLFISIFMQKTLKMLEADLLFQKEYLKTLMVLVENSEIDLCRSVNTSSIITLGILKNGNKLEFSTEGSMESSDSISKLLVIQSIGFNTREVISKNSEQQLPNGGMELLTFNSIMLWVASVIDSIGELSHFSVDFRLTIDHRLFTFTIKNRTLDEARQLILS